MVAGEALSIQEPNTRSDFFAEVMQTTGQDPAIVALRFSKDPEAAHDFLTGYVDFIGKRKRLLRLIPPGAGPLEFAQSQIALAAGFGVVLEPGLGRGPAKNFEEQLGMWPEVFRAFAAEPQTEAV